MFRQKNESMIDTHSHIYLDQFKEDLDEVLQRAVEAGVSEILMPAISFESLPQMDQLAHPKIIFHKMAGIHPCDVSGDISFIEDELQALARRDDIIAIGETGLDYYWSTDFKENQKKSLRIHCRIAKETGKPIVLHNRDSTSDLLDIIAQEQDGRLTGVWHCFTGSESEGKRALDLNLHLGIGGVTTFKNAGVDKVVAQLPLDKMLLETDAPYLAPVPKRGKRNEPAFMRYTAQKLADLKEKSLTEVDEITTATAQKLFGI